MDFLSSNEISCHKNFRNCKFYLSKAGFPKVGQVAHLGSMTDFQGATSSKGARGGAMRSKFETYTRYSWVADKEQKKKSQVFFMVVYE